MYMTSESSMIGRGSPKHPDNSWVIGGGWAGLKWLDTDINTWWISDGSAWDLD